MRSMQLLDSTAGVKAFYDIDTPITVSKLRAGDAEYLRRDQVPGFDVYFSFTGGPMLARIAIPIRSQARGPALLFIRSRPLSAGASLIRATSAI